MLRQALVAFLSLAVFLVNNNPPNQSIFNNHQTQEQIFPKTAKATNPPPKEATKAPPPVPKSTTTPKIQDYLFYQTMEESGESSLWALDPGNEPIKILTYPGQKFYSAQQNQWFLIKTLVEDFRKTPKEQSGRGISLWVSRGLMRPVKIAEGGYFSPDFLNIRIFGNPPEVLTSVGTGYDKKLVTIDLENLGQKVLLSGFEYYTIEYPRGELKTQAFIKATKSYPNEEIAWFRLDLVKQEAQEILRDRRIYVYPGYSQGKVLIKKDLPGDKSEIYLTDETFREKTLIWQNSQAYNISFNYAPSSAPEFALMSFYVDARPVGIKTTLVINVLNGSVTAAPRECQRLGDIPSIIGGYLLVCGRMVGVGPMIAFNLRTNEILPLLKDPKEGGPWGNTLQSSEGKERTTYWFSPKGYILQKEPIEATLSRNQVFSRSLKQIAFVREDNLFLSDWKGDNIVLIAEGGFEPRWLRLFQQN